MNKWGKLKLVKAMVEQVVNKALMQFQAILPKLTKTSRQPKLITQLFVSKENQIIVFDADMNELFYELM